MIVDLLPNEDQESITASLSGFFNRNLPVERLRDPAARGGAAERAHWTGFTELGLFGLGLDAEQGGVGFGIAEEVLAAVALGRYLVSPSVLGTMLAIHAASAAGDDALVGRLVSGEERTALAVSLQDSGELLVIDGQDAASCLSWDRAKAAITPNPGANSVGAMDETVTLATVNAGTALVSLTGEEALALSRRASLLISAYLVGMAESVQELAVEHAKTRHQFGQPIGAFQAIKHACADMAVRTEAAMAQTCYAALSGEARDGAAARLLAGEAALENSRASIQVHGALGFTAEADIHRYLKRSHLFVALNSSHRGELAALLGD